jgi:hypothetical protein
MPKLQDSGLRQWFVPPLVVPLFLLLTVLASVLFRS